MKLLTLKPSVPPEPVLEMASVLNIILLIIMCTCWLVGFDASQLM